MQDYGNGSADICLVMQVAGQARHSFSAWKLQSIWIASLAERNQLEIISPRKFLFHQKFREARSKTYFVCPAEFSPNKVKLAKTNSFNRVSSLVSLSLCRFQLKTFFLLTIDFFILFFFFTILFHFFFLNSFLFASYNRLFNSLFKSFLFLIHFFTYFFFLYFFFSLLKPFFYFFFYLCYC